MSEFRTFAPLLDAVEAGRGSLLLDVATGPGLVAGRAVARGARAVRPGGSVALTVWAGPAENVPVKAVVGVARRP